MSGDLEFGSLKTLLFLARTLRIPTDLKNNLLRVGREKMIIFIPGE